MRKERISLSQATDKKIRGQEQSSPTCFMQREEFRAMFDLEEHLWWYTGMRAITASILDPYISKRSSMSLLDAGCGTGFSIAWMSELFHTREAFGIDVSSDGADFWRRRGVDGAAIASIYDLPFGSDRFDLVTCFDVIYQFSDDDATKAVSEIYRTLKPGGILFIREPAYDWLRGSHDVAVGTRRRYTLRRLRGLLLRQGLKPKRATYANTLLFGAAIPHRLLSRLKGESDSDVKPVPALLNRAFVSALRLEARLLRRLSFPFGLSVIILAEKAKD